MPPADSFRLAVQTVQMLAVDAVEQAHSGHPGMPMGTADFACTLWLKSLRFHPQDPLWPNRDRFVLSAGHGSMLQYALLHLSGYDLSLEDLKKFRQWGSRTPGHPEYRVTPGVELSTGPLGQGFGNGVGMALAARILAERFREAGDWILDHRVYGIVSDGDLMEGVASEAASLAGHWGLSNLVYFYDDNRVTIDGKTDLSFTEDVRKRFDAYGWHTIPIDGHDVAAIERSLDKAVAESRRPTLILGRTVIGKGNHAREGTRKAHSDAFGVEEVRKTKENIGWPLAPAFHVPEEVRALFRARVAELKPRYDRWQERFRSLPEPVRARWKQYFQPEPPADLEARLLAAVENPAASATREAGSKVIQEAARWFPGLVGGSADLAVSNKTTIASAPAVSRTDFSGRNLHFGVREHGMGSILNGLALSGGIRPFGATFLVFADYMRPSIRLAALMEIPVVFVFTHDSIFVGEDGPTHQPVEHLAALRCIPDLSVIRPADARETAVAWAVALRNTHGPTALVLTRQNVPVLDPKAFPDVSGVRRGGYVLSDERDPQLILIGTGSEVHQALETKALLQKRRGLRIRVVSMPAPTLFDRQDADYRSAVLPEACRRRVSIEAASTFGWARYVGPAGLSIGIDHFGSSAPCQRLAEEFGLTTEKVVGRIETWLDAGLDPRALPSFPAQRCAP